MLAVERRGTTALFFIQETMPQDYVKKRAQA